MIDSDVKKFATLLTSLGELYSKPMSEILIEIYWQVLKKYSLQEIKTAVRACVTEESDGRFMPKPADIIRHINNQGRQKALDAWGKVENAIRQVGRYSTVAFDDQLIHFVIQKMGGWVNLCSQKICQMPATSNTFVQEYTACLNNFPAIIPPYVSGLFLDEIIKVGQPPPHNKITRQY
jgi:hypothetical protein